MRHAIIREGIVKNVCEWDGDIRKWSPPEGATVRAFPTGKISPGWQWNNGAPIDPTPPPPVVLPIDKSDLDNIEKAIKAALLVCAAWNGKTPGQAKAAFKAAWDALP